MSNISNNFEIAKLLQKYNISEDKLLQFQNSSDALEFIVNKIFPFIRLELLKSEIDMSTINSFEPEYVDSCSDQEKETMGKIISNYDKANGKYELVYEISKLMEFFCKEKQ